MLALFKFKKSHFAAFLTAILGKGRQMLVTNQPETAIYNKQNDELHLELG